MNYKKTIVPIILILLLSNMCITIGTAKDYGIGVSSMPIKIENGLRGMTYYQTITIHNNENNVTEVSLRSEGEIKDWITFCEYDDSTKTLEKVHIPAKSQYKVRAVIKIPENVPNKNYESKVFVSEKGIIKNQTGYVEVNFSYPLPVTVSVTGNQILDGVVESVILSDTEVEYPIVTKIFFRNTGNVIAIPEIYVKFYKNDLFVEEIGNTDTKVQPSDIHRFELNWNTEGMVPGEYTANITVMLGDKTLHSEDKTFNLFKVGTLNREGELIYLTGKGTPKSEKDYTIVSIFSNTGQIEVKAKFIGKVYKDNKLIETIESMELLVPVGVEQEFYSKFFVPEDGSYKINGSFQYDDVYGFKQTNFQEMKIRVGAIRLNVESSSSNNYFVLVIPVLVIFALVVLILYKKRQTTSTNTNRKDKKTDNTKKRHYAYEPLKVVNPVFNKDKTKQTNPIIGISNKKPSNVIAASDKKPYSNKIEDLVDNVLNVRKKPASEIYFEPVDEPEKVTTKLNENNNISKKPEEQQFQGADTPNNLSSFTNTAQRNNLADEPITPEINTEELRSEEINDDTIDDLIEETIDNKKTSTNVMIFEPDEVFNINNTKSTDGLEKPRIFPRKPVKKHRIPRIKRRRS